MFEIDLRDYFASKAMNGCVANCPTFFSSPEKLAKYAYELADAMMKAREL